MQRTPLLVTPVNGPARGLGACPYSGIRRLSIQRHCARAHLCPLSAPPAPRAQRCVSAWYCVCHGFHIACHLITRLRLMHLSVGTRCSRTPGCIGRGRGTPRGSVTRVLTSVTRVYSHDTQTNIVGCFSGAMSNGYWTRIHPRDTGVWSWPQSTVRLAALQREPDQLRMFP